MPADLNLSVVTPWLPTERLPFRGSFVRTHVELMAEATNRLDVFHLEEWVSPPASIAYRRVADDTARLVTRGAATVRVRLGHTLHRIPSPVLGGRPVGEFARVNVRMLRHHLPGGRLPAGIVHGHVGLRGGLPAVRLARAGSRVFVTEHASFLSEVLEVADNRRLYQEVLAGSSRFFVVGTGMRDQLVAAFPDAAGTIEVLPNPVDFTRVRKRNAPVVEPRRWLYVGSFIPRKRVLELVEVFGHCLGVHPGMSLTMVGEGPLRASVLGRIAELGLGDAVTMKGPVDPEVALGLYADHDLLVHLSRHETFGMTVVEAIAAGLPVVVAASEGPLETVGKFGDQAVLLVGVDDPPQRIAEKVLGFIDRFDGLAVAAARDELAGRYGADVIRDRLLAHYRGDLT